MRFKPGQQVVCIEDDWFVEWREDGQPDSSTTGPRKNEIVTVMCYEPNTTYVRFEEYKYDSIDGEEQYFHEEYFEPLMEITELTEILEHQTQEI